MGHTPLLLLAYNRPEKMRGLVEALRPLAPRVVYVVVDGPKPGDARDAERVQQVRDAVAEIDWEVELHTRFRPVNVGLRASISDAVTWAVREYGQVAVIEEDVVPGPAFLPYVDHMLDVFRDDDRIMHISGYNVVPRDVLSAPSRGSRLTRYPESIAWATWDRAWRLYDDGLSWPGARRIHDLRRVVGRRPAAAKWVMNFRDASAGRISTWAYRWIASMWAHDGFTVSPNENLVDYVGHDDGTHTVTGPSWRELPRYDGPIAPLLEGPVEHDDAGDRWVNRVVFRGTPLGVTRGIVVTGLLELRRRRRLRRALTPR